MHNRRVMRPAHTACMSMCSSAHCGCQVRFPCYAYRYMVGHDGACWCATHTSRFTSSIHGDSYHLCTPMPPTACMLTSTCPCRWPAHLIAHVIHAKASSQVWKLPVHDSHPCRAGATTVTSATHICAAWLVSTHAVQTPSVVVHAIRAYSYACVYRMNPFDAVQVPTTVMSQVDSSVGGKTGVNHPLGKNMIGAFYQPQSVIIDSDTLATLPDRELASGFSEIIKYGLIG